MVMPEQGDISDVIHRLDLIQHDLNTVRQRVGELVSTERYTIEHDTQQRDLARIEAKVAEQEKRSETMRHMVLSSFLFPLAIAVILYLIQSGGS